MSALSGTGRGRSAGAAIPFLRLTHAEWRWLFLLMGAGLLLRVALIAGWRTYDIPASGDHFYFAAEYGRIARWLALGHGYASPYDLNNDMPTVRGAPLFPAYLALLFALFGVYSRGAAAALLVSNSVVSVLMVPLVFLLGRRLFGRAVGRLAAVLSCFDPAAIWFSVANTWETALSCTLLTLMPAVLLWLGDEPTAGRGALAGLTLGVAAHANAATLPVGVVLGTWLVLRSPDRRAVVLRSLGMMAVVTLLVILPWSVRNTLVAGRPMFLRGGDEVALYVGNRPEGTGGRDDVMLADPWYNRREGALYYAMGEREYFRRCRERAMAFIRSHPVDYARRVVKRAVFFWLGDPCSLPDSKAGRRGSSLLDWCKYVSHLAPVVLALMGGLVAWRRNWSVWPLVGQMLAYASPFVLVHCNQLRYRGPIEGSLVLLGAVALHASSGALFGRHAAKLERAS